LKSGKDSPTSSMKWKSIEVTHVARRRAASFANLIE
jgi:hypothetical protein